MSVQEIVRSLAGTAMRCCIALVLALFLVAPVLAQDYIGPADDPFYPQEEDDKSVLTAPAITSDKTGGGTGDTVFIETVDPALFPEICTYVTVTHNGSTVPGLDPDSFCVRQDGIVIDSFTAVQQTLDSCITKICLVIDRSGSMNDGGKITAAKNAALALMRQMDQYDQMAVVSFSDCFTVNQNFTTDTVLIKAAITGLVANGRTAAFDGTWKGVDITKLLTGSKAVIALTDGLENESQDCSAPPDGLTDSNFSDDSTLIVNFAKASSVPIYSITLGTDFNVRYMKGLALGSGGGYYHAPTTATLESIYLAIKERLCRRYLICYTSPDTIQDGTCHTLVICRDNADGDKTGTPDCYVCDTTVFCEPNPPVIDITVDPACRRWGKPVDLCATVTDSDTPANKLLVRLFYRIYEAGGPFLEVTPSRVGNVFCHTIPAAFLQCGKDSIEFYFTASDSITSVASPYNAPLSSHQVTICQNHPPTCEFGPNLAPPVCNPSSPIDFVPLNLTDIDNNKLACYIWGDGQLVPGGWQNDNAIPGDTAKAWITCIDSCGDSCNLYIERFYPPRELIPCNIPDGGDTAFFLCDPGQIVIPVTGGPGSGCEIVSGAGELINGEWRWNATKDTVITFVVQCVSLCDSCYSSYTVSINVNEPPICGDGGASPTPSGGELCDTVNISDHYTLTFKSVSYDGNNSTWCYELVWDGIPPGLSHLTFELCDDLTQANFVSSSPAGASIGQDGSTGLYGLKFDSEDLPAIPANTPVQFCFTINEPLAVAQTSFVPKAGQNDDIVEICGPSTSCEEYVPEENPAPCDTTVFLCDSGEVCVPYAAADPDNNLSHCTIISGPGSLVNGNWCFFARETGTFFVTIQCVDSCGDVCEQTLCATVVIDEKPEITCPDPITYECDSIGAFPVPTVVDGGYAPATIRELSRDSIPGQCPQSYGWIITWVASDTCGHADTCQQRIAIVDTTDPVIACPDTAAYSCESVPTSWDAPSATDNCDESPVVTLLDSISIPSNLCPQNYTKLLRWVARDGCYNADTCVQVIHVYDSTAPDVTCPPDTTLSCTDDFPIPQGLKGITPGADIKTVPNPWPFGVPSATDNCDDLLLLSGKFGDILDRDSCHFVFQVLYIAEDDCGNKDTCTQIVTVVDTLDPVIECPVTSRYECNNIPSSFPPPGAKDACNSVTVSEIGRYRQDSTCAYEYTLVIVWEAKDKCGNADTCRQLVEIFDDAAPRISVPDKVTYNCDSVPAEYPRPTAQDQCDPDPTLSLDKVDTTKDGCLLIIQLTWTATDICGNKSGDYIQYVNVLDRTAPVITCPDTIRVECDETVPLDSLPKPTVTDNCDDSVKLERFAASSTAAPCVDSSYMTILWVATDDCGNVDSCVQVVITNDTTAPVLDKCDTLFVFECTIQSKDAQSITPYLPTATDNCDPDPDVRYAYGPSGGVWGCDYHITFGIYAVDRCGNVSDTCYQTIWVIDTTKPVIDCPVDTLVVECPNQIILVPPSATDNCGRPVDVTAVGDTIVDSTCIGSYLRIVTWEARDYCGNKDTCLQYIRHRDTQAPVIQCAVGGTVSCDDTIITTAPKADDLCDPAPTVREIGRHVVDSTSPCDYVVVVAWEAMDDCGNADTCESFYTIVDNLAPVITCPGDTLYSCSSVPDTSLWPKPTATDNCDTNVRITLLSFDSTFGQCINDKIFILRWNATDDCLNSSECLQTVYVRDTTKPEITCPADTTLECDDIDPNAFTDKITPVPEFIYGTPTTSDNCDDSLHVYWTWGGLIDDNPCHRQFRIIYWAYDNCNNFDSCTQIVTVVDTTSPVVTCPDPDTVLCTEIPTFYVAPPASDNCDNDVQVTQLGEPRWGYADCPTPDTIVVTWVAVDNCDNADTCFQYIHVIDSTPPVLFCEDVRYECDSIPTEWTKPGAKDMCDPAPVVTLISNTDTTLGACPQRYSFILTWEAMDECGNADTCKQTVYIYDETAPVVTCPNDTIIACQDIPPTLLGSAAVATSSSKVPIGAYPFGTPSSIDNCDPTPEIYWYVADQGGTFPCNKTFIIGYWSVDSCGNASDTCFQDVSIVDTLDPDLTCPPDTSLDCVALGGKVSDLVIGQDMKGPGALWPYGVPTATDNCDAAPFIYGPIYIGTQSSDSCQYVLMMQYIATDKCQNADTCVQLVTIIDTIAPVFKCPDSLVFQCTQNSCKAALDAGNFKEAIDCASATAAIAFDVFDQCDPEPNVDIVRVDTLSEVCPFAYQLVLVARDSCGNTSDTCFWKWVFEDTTAPRIDCPAERRISCDQLWDGVFDGDSLGWPIAVDECDLSPEIKLTGYSQIGSGCTYIIRRAFVAIDTCGNISDTCFQDITVYDETAPTIVCPPDTLVDCTEMARYNNDNPKLALERMADGSASKNAQGCYEYDWAFGTPTGDDNCNDSLRFCLQYVVRDPGACSTTFTLIFTASDSCGNMSDTCSQRVIFADTTAPVVDCADDTTVYCSNIPPCFDSKSSGKSGEKFLCDFRLIDTVYDACDPYIEYDYELSYHFEQCPRYVRAKIWAVDDCGNISDTCLWTVYFDDTVAPVIACPQDINAECGSNPGDWGQPTATDDCAGQPVIALLDIDTVAQTSCYLEVTRRFTATDFCGNADTCTQYIVIGDSTAPVIDCPNDTVVSCEDPLAREGRAMLDGWLPLPPKGRVQGQCELNYNFLFGMPTATDNCTPEPHICLIDVKLKESTTCSFNYVLTFEAVDECGNADTCEQSVTFIDNEGPTLVCAPDTTIYCDDDKAACIQLKGTETFELKGDDKFLCGFRIVDTVYDGCCENVTLYSRLTYHLNQCPAYVRVFVWAKDCCGNYSDTCKWILNIADTAAPVITCPQDLTFECDEVQGEWGWPTATDNCDANVAVTLFDQDTLTEGCERRIIRTFSAKDRCNQESRCQQVITISDTTDPVCNVPNDTTIFICGPGQQICLPVSATDNCDQAVECVVADGAGDIANGMWCYTPTEPGPVTAYIRCTDDCGNSCSSDFTVTFELNSAPECHLPNDTTIYLCDPAPIVLYGWVGDLDGNLAVCSVSVDYPEVKAEKGLDADSETVTITINTEKDLYACIYVKCVDSCGEVCYDTFCVKIDITEIQECYQTPDTTVTLCNPQEICILYDWLDPVKGGSTSSDVVSAPRGGKGKYSTPQRVPQNQPVANPGTKTIYDQCIIAQGPGELKGDYWCWTPPDHDTVVTVRIVCGDTCFHTCTNEFTVTYDMDLNPVCSLLVDLIDPICTPDTDFVPYLSYDPDGTTECYLVGDGELVPGGWQFANPEPGTSANVKIVCKDACDSCIIDFTRNYPERIPVECRVPDAIDTVLCQPTTLLFPVGGGQGAVCRVISGPGAVSQNEWVYEADHDTSFCVTIECKSLCDSCTAQFCVTIDMNDPPVCELPNDTTIFLCDTATICLPVGATDPNGNFSACSINDGKAQIPGYGYISNGQWCYFATQSGSVTVPVICYDSCGAYCQGEFTVTFIRNEPPVCQLPNDTTIFLCEPATVCLPIGATDVNGNFSHCQFDVPSKSNGYGYLLNGLWCYDVTEDTKVAVYIACYDSCGAACRGQFTVTFDVNEAPVCNPIKDTNIFLCGPTEFCLPVGATDADENPVTCQVISGPGSVSNGFWCFTPQSEGQYNVTIRCSDPCEASCEESFTVNVTFNDEPVCNGPSGDTTIFLCSPAQVCLNWGATDPNGNLLECIVVDDDKGVPTGVGVQWCDFISVPFTKDFVIRCTDSCGAICERTLTVHFTFNNPPVINLGDDIATLVGDGQVCFNYTVSDPQGFAGLVEELWQFPTGAVIDTAANTICWTPEEAGFFTFIGRVNDPCNANDFDTAFVLVAQPAPPICNIPNDTTITLCNLQQISLPVSATSQNPPVNCVVSAGPGSISGGFWRYTPPSAGVYNVSITCTDAQNGQCNGSFQVTVLLNQAPVCNVRDTSVFICETGTQLCIPVTGTDPEGGVVTCTKISGPGTLTNGVWCYTANADAAFTVTFRCSDPCGLYCEKTVNININTNEAPICTVPFNQTVVICPGDQICINLSSIDLDGNLDTCGIKDGLGEVLPNGPNGQYRWCYTPTAPGVVPVTIFCADHCGDTCFTPRQYSVLFNTPGNCGSQQHGQVIIIGPAAIMNAGDVNGSGDVNVADLALLTAIVHQQNLRGKTAAFDVSAAAAGHQYKADINCDGTVDRADVAYLTQYIFNSGPAPCEPGTE